MFASCAPRIIESTVLTSSLVASAAPLCHAVARRSRPFSVLIVNIHSDHVDELVGCVQRASPGTVSPPRAPQPCSCMTVSASLPSRTEDIDEEQR
jgi:hypothetical protein